MSRLRTIPLLLSLAVLGGACADMDSAAKEAPAAPDPIAVDAAAQVVTEPDAAPAADRMIIRTANLELRADDPARVAATATTLAEDAGGFVAHSQSAGVDTEIDRVDLRLRVPADRFDTVMSALRNEGELLSEAVTGEDVTDQYTDLMAQLRSHKALEERLLDILSRSDAVEDLLKVEEHLVRVRTQIERLEGQRQLLENRVRFATIEVGIYSPIQHRDRDAESTSSVLGRALDDAYELAVFCLAGLIRVVGFLLPLFLIGIPIGFAARRAWRIRRARHLDRPSA